MRLDRNKQKYFFSYKFYDLQRHHNAIFLDKKNKIEQKKGKCAEY